MSSLGDASRRKKNLLIDGRRVRISDLIDAGLLTPGQELLFQRPRAGEVHRAMVTDSGGIRLADGQDFTSPSGAAAAVTSVSLCQ